MVLERWKVQLEKFLFRRSALFQRWRQYTSEQLVGLDIGPGFIKLLKIDSEQDLYRVEGLGIASLPLGAIIKEEVKNFNAINSALREVFDESGVKTKNIALAIPRSSTITKTITIDSRLNAADIESRAWIEANHHFPDLVGDIYLDFDIVGPSAQDSSQLELLLVACRKDQVKPYLDILRESGLNARIVDVNCYALERALSLIIQKTPLQTVALLNVDYNLSSLIVVHQHQLIYAHDHSFEGLNFVTQVQQYLKGGDKAKGTLADLAYVDILKAGITAHLRHAINVFYSSRPHIAIQEMVLSGDCSTIPFLNAFIQQETGIKTITADPFMDMEIMSSVNREKLKQYASALTLCCGLALNTLKETKR